MQRNDNSVRENITSGRNVMAGLPGCKGEAMLPVAFDPVTSPLHGGSTKKLSTFLKIQKQFFKNFPFIFVTQAVQIDPRRYLQLVEMTK